LFADPAQNLTGTVGNGGGADLLPIAQLAFLAGKLVAQAKVAVPAGLRDHRPRGINARSRHEAFVDGPFQGEGRAAHVPDRREPPHQRAFGLGARLEVNVTDVGRHQRHEGQGREHGVPMRVDQAGHQGAAAAVDDLRIVGGGGVAGVDRFDLVAFDEHLRPLAHCRRSSVEHAHVFEEDGLFGFGRDRGGLRPGDAKGSIEEGSAIALAYRNIRIGAHGLPAAASPAMLPARHS
jgi:hypothetical protein